MSVPEELENELIQLALDGKFDEICNFRQDFQRKLIEAVEEFKSKPRPFSPEDEANYQKAVERLSEYLFSLVEKRHPGVTKEFIEAKLKE
ncbi:MAG: hypothetical protein HQL15_04110 [Candidatus Omnitrophica bacterium]|nr:hypothetical protein [Candidatus Omnitrophota bacterium]